MPSPLNGFTDPSASPAVSQLGPTLGFTENPVGSLPPVGAPHSESAEMPQRVGRGVAERLHEVRGVHVLPTREGGEQPDADVHRPVADREDPSVAGEVVAVLVADVEVRLDPGFVVERAREVAAHRHAERIRAVARRAERPPEAGVGAVGHEHVARPDRLGDPGLLALHHRAAHEAVLDQRLDGLGGRPERRARLHRDVGDHLVEVAPTHDVAVVGKVGVVGPRQLERDAVPDRPQAVEALELGEALARGPCRSSCFTARGREAVAARLLTGEPLLLDHQHPVAALGEPVRGRRAGRARRRRRGRPNRSASDPVTEDVAHRASCGRRAVPVVRGPPGRPITRYAEAASSVIGTRRVPLATAHQGQQSPGQIDQA